MVGQFADGYAVWAWLTTELVSLDGAMPLTLLAGGEIDRVAKAAGGVTRERPGGREQLPPPRLPQIRTCPIKASYVVDNIGCRMWRT